MPREGEYDLSYPDRLIKIGLLLNEEFKGAKQHHSIKCLECGNVFVATPISKLQNYKKHKLTGCPKCCGNKKYEQVRLNNIQKLLDRGLMILSDWDGTVGTGKDSIAVNVTIQNIHCGHIFTSTSKNLLTRNVECGVCGPTNRISKATAWSKQNSEEWKKTADIWQQYKSKVTKLTRKSYQLNKDKINPNNLPTGRAGTEGAYHLDHIVPIRYCFENYIPAEVCAHPDNLQMLHWTDNVGSRDKLKEYIPGIFVDFITIV